MLEILKMVCIMVKVHLHLQMAPHMLVNLKMAKNRVIGTFTCWVHGAVYVGKFINGMKHGEGAI